MNKLKHTPGPWKISLWHNEKALSIIKELGDFPGGRRLEEVAYSIGNEANANLIACAPDLLKALIEISEYLFRNDKNSIYHKSAFHRMINDLIEKATGESIDKILGHTQKES